MKKRLSGLFAALLVGAGLVVVTAVPASASWSDCQFGQVCTWFRSDAVGQWYYYTSPGPNVCVNIGPGWNDNIAAISNRSSVATYWYSNANCTGGYGAGYGGGPIPVPANQQRSWSSLGGGPGFSSFRWNRP
jgi:hypothetical protein